VSASSFRMRGRPLRGQPGHPYTAHANNISAIYRPGWLARKLKISVREFLLLTQLTGLDPFAAPDPTNPAVLRIIELVQTLKAGSLKTSPCCI